MAVTTQVIAVTSVAGLLITANRGSVSDPTPVVFYAASAGAFIGGAGVTTSTGIPLPATTPFSFSLIAGDDIYGVSTGSVNVTVFKGRS